MGRRPDANRESGVVRDRDLTDESIVVLHFVGAPVELMQGARLHLEAINREFQLIEFGDEADTPPARLLGLLGRLRASYDQLGFLDNRRYVTDALDRDDDYVDFDLPVPRQAGAAARRLSALMDETDTWCEQGELLTLASPPDQRAMRHWLFGEIERQVAGGEPIPWSEAAKP
jgi:hypothetical protein